MNPQPHVVGLTVVTTLWPLALPILVIALVVLHRPGRCMWLLLRRARNRRSVAVMRAHASVLPPDNRAQTESRLRRDEDLLAGMKIVSRVGAPAPTGPPTLDTIAHTPLRPQRNQDTLGRPASSTGSPGEP